MRLRAAGLLDALAARPIIAIVLLVAAQHIFTFWSRDLWWSDEVRQANVLQNLVQHGDWLALRLNDSLYPDKPPLYFWFLGGLALLFGSTAPPVIFFGLALTVLAFCLSAWWLGLVVTGDRRVAVLAAIVLATGGYFMALTHYARMDALFSAFIVTSWGCFYLGLRRPGFSWWIVAGFAASAAALMIKGPLGFVFPALTLLLFLFWKRDLARLLRLDMALGLLLVILTVAAWAGGLALAESPDYVRRIFFGQVVQRGFTRRDGSLGPLRYIVTAPIVFMPWTLALIGVNWRRFRERAFWRSVWNGRGSADDGAPFLWIAALGGIAVLTLVREKHEYYLLPLLAPLAVLCAARLMSFSADQWRRFWIAIAICFGLSAVALAVAGFVVPFEVSIAGLLLSALAAAGVAAAAWLWRERGPGPALAGLLAGQVLWINAVAILVMPSLADLLSPRALALSLKADAADGYAIAAFDITAGALAYDLGAPYFETGDREKLEAWLASQPRAVVAMSSRAWERMRGASPALQFDRQYPVSGRPIIVARRPGGPD